MALVSAHQSPITLSSAEDGEARETAEHEGVRELIETLDRESRKIQTFTSKSEKDAIFQGSWTGSDPRHVDIQTGKW